MEVELKNIEYGFRSVIEEMEGKQDVVEILKRTSPKFYGILAIEFVGGAKFKGEPNSPPFRKELSNTMTLFKFALATLYSASGKRDFKIEQETFEKLLAKPDYKFKDPMEDVVEQIRSLNEMFAESFEGMMKDSNLCGFSRHVLALTIKTVIDTLLRENPKKKRVPVNIEELKD